MKPHGEETEPVSSEEITEFLTPLKIDPFCCAVAVSGGPDSMALAACLKGWTPQAPLRAFIVDHRLRSESTDEAKTVQQRLQAMGYEAEILTWAHGPIASRVHVHARKARYALLIGACHRHGVQDLLFAHHQDDQAETVLMRLAKGSGIDGLAGMAPVGFVEGVRLLRPWLTVPKKRLVATCHALNVPFVTDPSNAKTAYARGRLRRVEALLSEEGLTTERLLDLSARAREAKEALDHYTRALVRVASRMDEAGVIRLDLEHLRSAPTAVALRAVAACLQSVNPQDYAPERQALVPLMQALLTDAPMGARTLQGCLIGKTARHAVILRELAAITESLTIAPGQTVLWDGRWQVTLGADWQKGDLTVRALGFQTHDVLDALAPGLRQRIPQGRVRATLPGLWKGKTLALVPDSSGTECSRALKQVSITPPILDCRTRG